MRPRTRIAVPSSASLAISFVPYVSAEELRVLSRPGYDPEMRRVKTRKPIERKSTARARTTSKKIGLRQQREYAPDGLPLFKIPPKGAERREALLDLRRAVLDNLEEMELRGDTVGEQAKFMAEQLWYWRGTRTDDVSVERRARMIELAFDTAKSDEPLDASVYERVRVRLARALRRIGAAPPKTGKKREAKRKATLRVKAILDVGGHDLATQTGRLALAARLALVFLDQKHLTYLRNHDPYAVLDVVRRTLPKPGYDWASKQLAFEIADALWTDDPNADAHDEPAPLGIRQARSSD